MEGEHPLDRRRNYETPDEEYARPDTVRDRISDTLGASAARRAQEDAESSRLRAELDSLVDRIAYDAADSLPPHYDPDDIA